VWTGIATSRSGRSIWWPASIPNCPTRYYLESGPRRAGGAARGAGQGLHHDRVGADRACRQATLADILRSFRRPVSQRAPEAGRRSLASVCTRSCSRPSWTTKDAFEWRARCTARHPDVERHDAVRSHRDAARRRSRTCCTSVRCRTRPAGSCAFVGPLAVRSANTELSPSPGDDRIRQPSRDCGGTAPAR